MKTRISVLWLCLLPLLALQVGCDEVKCGDGTIKENGECRSGLDPTSSCGAGTVLSPSGQCVPDLDAFGICGENTAIEVNDAGVPVCVGIGGGGCSDPIPCGTPNPNRVNVCGRIHDTETLQPIFDGMVEGVAATLSIGVFDAIAVAGGDPANAVPDQADLLIDDCGRFRIQNAPAPPSGFIAVGINDAGDIPQPGMSGMRVGANDMGTYRLTGVAGPASPGSVVRLVGFLTRADTLTAWEAVTGGDILSQGAFIPHFFDPRDLANRPPGYPHPGAPVAGVQIMVGNSPAPAARDFYFDNTDISLSMISASGPMGDNRTGPNGSGVLLDSVLGPHGGQGGGCSNWGNTTLAAAPANVIFVQERPCLD